MEDEAAHLKRTLGFSAELADSVSGKIRHLDSAKHRVEECLQRIEDVLDLSFCTEGVRLAMENEEYEVAAMHVNRFLKMDKSGLLNSADDMQQRGSLKESLSLLQEAQHKLETIINVRFEEALNTADVANVERLFKIFPLLNLHAVGLKKFCTYLCSNVSIGVTTQERRVGHACEIVTMRGGRFIRCARFVLAWTLFDSSMSAVVL